MTIPWNFTGYYSVEEWKEIIEDWEKSRLSKRAYCKMKGIPSHSFYRWHAKIYSLNSLSLVEIRERWEKIVKNWEKSGLSKSAYCRQRGLNIATLDRWEKKLNPHILRKTIHEIATEKWAPIVEDWRKSGLSRYAYCKKNKREYSVFYKWVKYFGHTCPLDLHLKDKLAIETSMQEYRNSSFPCTLLLKGDGTANQRINIILSQGERFCLEGPFDWPKLMDWLTPLLRR